MNSNTPSPTPGDIIAQYRAKISTRSSDAGVKEGEVVLASCVSKPWWRPAPGKERAS